MRSRAAARGRCTLVAPTTLTLAHRKARLGAAQFTVADGTVDISRVRVGRGAHQLARPLRRGTARYASRGSRVARSPCVRRSRSAASGRSPPRPSSTAPLSCVASRVTCGSSREGDAGTTNAAAGITELEATAHARDDAIDATLPLPRGAWRLDRRHRYAGRRRGRAPGRISPRAPLALTLVADLPSLAVLQPWAGTTAVVDGKLHADLAAHGTLARRAGVGNGARERT